ncbi:MULTISPECIES: hypothetical protein [Bacillus]|uniref:hypothetical protein n=1 Tax=Bacillus TaxID=1386 RepID=UPI0003096601|nr:MULTISPECIES: hypothetical protein [Bacillus]QKL22946.1 hypothetical protein RI02_15085 [Bacillus altitudinis]QKL26679.1 hypothetical protein EQK04_15085 [Bacillus altitudinis]QXY97057.1 hypothetical protein G4D59_14945 [Bacillus altitudinis]TFW49004.1 hypothetical protein ES896_00915 [Bacillus sp. 005/A4HT-01/001]
MKKDKNNNYVYEKQNLDVKKRIMFAKDEDYNFITYNILILLDTYDCNNSKSKWTDYRKLNYLLPFISNNSILEIFLKYHNSQQHLKRDDLEILRITYIKSRLNLKLVASILFTLEANGYVNMSKNEKRRTVDIWINKKNISRKFLRSDLFSVEISNINKIKEAIPRLKMLKTLTLLERLYEENGVRVWES